MMNDHVFAGIPAEAIVFLGELAANNERAWFEAHRADYETFVRRPMSLLVDALAPAMLTIDPAFDIGPRGPSVSRLHRDTRFSRDKSPYRVNQWIVFRRRRADWPDHPAFFMEFRPDGYRYGMGYYSATPATMKAVRAHIDTRMDAFLAAIATAREHGYAVEGEAYKRPILSDKADVRDWYCRKNGYLVQNRPLDAVFFKAALAAEIERGFRAAAPFYRFLAEAGSMRG